MSVPLSEYTEPGQIRDRLRVLHDKRARIAFYNASCKEGAPDLSLLDEKQQQTLAIRQQVRALQERPPLDRFPWSIWQTLGQTIHVLETRLAELKRQDIGIAA